ncbi:MAG: SUMF1/EgtB/PvdO family nonheme iron enzyme [Pirellulales bacterium]
MTTTRLTRSPPNGVPPFLVGQGIRQLTADGDPWPYLKPDYFRARRSGAVVSVEADARQAAAWTSLERDSVVAGVCTPDHPFRRLVVTTDAGIGKSVNLEWLQYAIHGRVGLTTAFVVNLGAVRTDAAHFLEDVLVSDFRRRLDDEKLDERAAADHLRRLRKRGDLVLLFDELDQIAAHSLGASLLKNLLGDPKWARCAIVIAGRPHALNAFKDDLFPGREWRFVQLDEFTPPQQKTFLGERLYERIRKESEAREILSVPRVLYYLRKLGADEVAGIRTPSDVYWRALRHMVRDGLSSDAASRLALFGQTERPPEITDPQVERAFKLLGAIAWEMLWSPDPDLRGEAADAPNFNRVEGVSALRRFRERLYRRFSDLEYDKTGLKELDHDLECLKAMNTALSHGVIDSPGFTPVLWRNRSLQEFFAAFWLAQHSTPDDAARLRDWVVIPGEPRGDACYWIWRYLVEMPSESPHDACDPEAWTRSVEPLYAPGTNDLPKTRRSNEMIYRSWAQLQRYNLTNQGHARRVLGAFLGEFESILRGDQGDARRDAARDFIDKFQDIPAGSFRMGTPSEKQGTSDEERESIQQMLQRLRDPAVAEAELFSMWPKPRGRQEQASQDANRRWWNDVIARQDVDAVLRAYRSTDESPEERRQVIAAFQLNRYPTLNAWYRLFDPSHGLRVGDPVDTYRRVSGTDDRPAIFISYFDAWVFCQWAHWAGQGCRLPFENEWEYACKACAVCSLEASCPEGGPCDWNYGWGDEFDERRCTADQAWESGSTTAPRDVDRDQPVGHRNGFGMVDMNGNVWEWCLDRYRWEYKRDDTDEQPYVTARVLRGGSWLNVPHGVRSSIRNGDPPSTSCVNTGFRVCRVVCVARGSS